MPIYPPIFFIFLEARDFIRMKTHDPRTQEVTKLNLHQFTSNLNDATNEPSLQHGYFF